MGNANSAPNDHDTGGQGQGHARTHPPLMHMHQQHPETAGVYDLSDPTDCKQHQQYHKHRNSNQREHEHDHELEHNKLKVNVNVNGNGNVDMNGVRVQYSKMEMALDPQHIGQSRSFRNSTQTGMTYDDSASLSTYATCTSRGTTMTSSRGQSMSVGRSMGKRVGTDTGAGQNAQDVERKQMLEQKFKHRQAQTQRPISSSLSQEYSHSQSHSRLETQADGPRPASAQPFFRRMLSGAGSGGSSANVNGSGGSSGSGSLTHPHQQEYHQQHQPEEGGMGIRTNRLRTRSIKLHSSDDEDKWENAWEEDSNSSGSASDGDGEGEGGGNNEGQRHGNRNGNGDPYPRHIPAHAQSPTGVGGDRERDPRDRLNSDSDISMSKMVDDALGNGEDAVTWETMAMPARDQVEEDTRPNLDMFSQLRVLGKGSFGKVILTQKCHGQEKGRLFAMKILRKTHLLKKQQIERTRTERKVLSIVDHPFIMKLHFAFQTEDKLYLVLDYCAGGELFFHLSRHKRFSEGWTRFYAAELLLALGHLHSKGIIYRDLKPENILLDSRGHLKLGDFGLAKSHIRHPFQGAKSRVGTPEYMAPEVIKKQGHGFTVDYWGLGMVTYEMMTGLPPWYTDDRSKIFKRLLRAQLTFPANTRMSPPLMNFIATLLDRAPHRRLGVRGANSVKCHPFFRRLDFRALERRRIDAPIRPCEGWKAPEPAKPKKGKILGLFSSSRQQPPNIRSLESEEVDAATANFDAQFTRMTLDSQNSVDYGEEDDDSDDGYSGSHREELNANSFVGFTFDDDPERQSFDDVVNI